MTRMDDGLPIVGPSVDMEKAPAINQKRTLTFINHFISHTVQFLNKFSASCEEKLSEMELKVQRLEITLSLLEAKLASIPGLEQVTVAETSDTSTTTTTATNPASGTATGVEPSSTEQQSPVEQPMEVQQEAPLAMTVAKDPRYAKFFKMMTVGVPVPAIKVKMSAEGLNPDLLDTPDAPAPGGGPTTNDDSDVSDDNNDSSSEASSFSDSD